MVPVILTPNGFFKRTCVYVCFCIGDVLSTWMWKKTIHTIEFKKQSFLYVVREAMHYFFFSKLLLFCNQRFFLTSIRCVSHLDILFTKWNHVPREISESQMTLTKLIDCKNKIKLFCWNWSIWFFFFTINLIWYFNF